MRGVVADFDVEVNRRRTKIVKPTEEVSNHHLHEESRTSDV